MQAQRRSVHGHWSSRWAFILAATGSAVGLGNIWKFPYITGENGGGAFVLVYLLCILAVGIPIMAAETLLGRLGRQSPINTMRTLAAENGRSPAWGLLGWMGVVAGFLILSYYSVIAGWALAYIERAATGSFSGRSGEELSAAFDRFVSQPEAVMFWHTVFMFMTMFVVSKGVRGGLEKAVRFLMPALFLLLLVLVGYAMNTDSFGRGVRFLFEPDFSRLSAQGVLTAVGHAFFTLSLGMGAIMVYGSYLPEHTRIIRVSVLIAAADTAVALLAGLAIFPLVFEEGLAPGAGPSLIFKTLPIAFGQMPGGTLFGTLFFILLTFAAWTSAISLIEPAVSYLVENRGWRRLRACLWAGGGAWLLGLGTVLSFNSWSQWYPLDWIPVFRDKTVFDLLDYLTANLMLPLGGLLIALFAGWFLSREQAGAGMERESGVLWRAWWFLVRYVSPMGVVVVFLHALGLLG